MQLYFECVSWTVIGTTIVSFIFIFRSFATEMAHGLPEPFVDLPVTVIRFISEILARFHFGLFLPQGLWTSALLNTENAKTFGFVQNPGLVG